MAAVGAIKNDGQRRKDKSLYLHSTSGYSKSTFTIRNIIIKMSVSEQGQKKILNVRREKAYFIDMRDIQTVHFFLKKKFPAIPSY